MERQSLMQEFVFGKRGSGMSSLLETMAEEIHYCGECALSCNRREILKGSIDFNSKKEVINCSVKDNPHLPDSYRHYKQHISVRRLACTLFKERNEN